MNHDFFILTAITAGSLASIFYIPKDKYRVALVSLLVYQTITWSTSLVLVQLGLYSFPIREFPRATQGSFLHLFVFYPALYAWFILLFPDGATLIKRISHYLIFVSVLVWFEYYMVAYTNLKRFHKYPMSVHLVITYIRFLLYFYVCRRYILWMAKKTHLAAGASKTPE